MQMLRCKLNERGFALPIVVFFALILFIFLSSIWFITSQETDHTVKYVYKIKAEGISEAIHTYLLSQCYSYSWDKRFYAKEIKFDMKSKTGVKDIDQMLESINLIVTGDMIINGKVTYNGSISSAMPKDGMRVIVIKIRILYDNILMPLDKRLICLHEYYDLYKRDLLDSLGEKIGIFYDFEKENLSGALPAAVVECFNKSSAGSIDISKIQYINKGNIDPNVNNIPK